MEIGNNLELSIVAFYIEKGLDFWLLNIHLCNDPLSHLLLTP